MTGPSTRDRARDRPRVDGAAREGAPGPSSLPRVDAVGPVASTVLSRRAFGGDDWTRRHTAVAVVLAPVMYAVYRSFAGPSATGIAWAVLLAVMAALAGVTLATYLPSGLRGRGAESSGRASGAGAAPCSASAVISIGLAAMVVQGAGQAWYSGLFALALVAIAATQRFLGASSCGSPR